MNTALEVLLALELVQVNLALQAQKVDSEDPYMKLLKRSVDTMITILKATMSKGSLEEHEQMLNGDMI